MLALALGWLAGPAPAVAAAPQEQSFAVSGGALSALIYMPAKRPAPAVIVLHSKTPRNKHEAADETFAAALAADGFVGVVVNYLDAVGGTLWSPRIETQLSQLVAALEQRPEVAGRPVGMVGFALGSHAILVSALDPAVKALVVYYGDYDLRKSKGNNYGPDVRMPMDVAAQIHAPLLLLHGERDDEEPVQYARAMEAAARASGQPVKLVVYPGAYHRFDRGPTAIMKSERSHDGYTYRFDETAARSAEAETLDWLNRYLGGQPEASFQRK